MLASRARVATGAAIISHSGTIVVIGATSQLTGLHTQSFARCCLLVLQVTGELGPVSLNGVTGGGSGSSSRAAAAAAAAVELQQAAHGSPSALGQPAGSSFNASRLHKSRSEVAQFGADSQMQSNASQQPDHSQPSSSSSSGCCKASDSGAAEASSCSSSSGNCRTVRHLTINAGGGRVTLRAMGWMDGVRAKLQAKQQQQQQ